MQTNETRIPSPRFSGAHWRTAPSIRRLPAFVYGSVLLLFTLSCQPPTEPRREPAAEVYPTQRVLTDRSGRQFEGTIVARTVDAVYVTRNSDQRNFMITFDRLSSEDRTFLETLPMKSPPADFAFSKSAAPPVESVEPDSTPVSELELLLFVTKSGQEFRKARLLRQDADSVLVRHLDGVATLAYEELPDDMQKQFGFDPELARESRARKKKEAAKRQALAEARETLEREAKAQQELRDKELQSAKRMTFKVLQVVPGDGGILANEYRRGGTPGSAARAISAISGRSSGYVSPSEGKTVFLRGELDPGLIDEDIFDAMVVEDGSYQYETTIGSMATVRNYKVIEMKIDDR